MREIEQALSWIREDEEMVSELEAVRMIGLPQACLSAGWIRNYVWDKLHGYDTRTPLNDRDVIYYDPSRTDEQEEKEHEETLRKLLRRNGWSVKNQARMHRRNGQAEPYSSVEDAMKRWPETATATGVRLTQEGRLEWIAPHGSGDLFGLLVRRSPYFRDPAFFLARVRTKGWLARWPKLRLIQEPIGQENQEEG
ncbi:nucleotidyltransferase family protein [Paenibacillus aurantius]|uniref:Nucleotidyltransferase family protein n=1 Tax=Paenibacillus aurantius TaxID=2918900 RepID=A0AA96LKP4_9BACL|nr:nucleotidyltransferase family protein [Paenibacillus aurantius]WNQ13846.1 nucleotidyltransferase family protein [Paenibacillus aurantius]